MEGKLQPQSIELEEIVLGSVLMDKDVMIQLISILKAKDFYKPNHGLIWESMISLFNESKPIDLVTMIERLKADGTLKQVGDMSYIMQLTNRVANTSNVEYHARIIKEKSLAREQIKMGGEIVAKAYDETSDVFETNDYILTEAYNLSDIDTEGSNQTNEELLAEAKEKTLNAKSTAGITGITTGIEKIDMLFKGYQDTDLIVKAGRPAMGKTAQALSEVYHMITTKKVLFFSLEMSSSQLMNRFITMATQIPANKIKEGDLSPDDWAKYDLKTEMLKTKNLKIIDSVFSFNGIRKAIKMQVLKFGVDIIYVDYLQLCHHNIKGGNREQEISQMSRGFKMIAKEMNVPIVLLSQLNRSVESRGDKKPMLSDLRESGAIEQDADIVQFLYRPEYYDIMEDHNGDSTQGLGYLIVAKYRNGALEDIPMRFVGECITFKSYDVNEHLYDLKQDELPKQLERSTDFEDDIF